MILITYKQLNEDIINNLYKIPRDVDIIVGIPRSGLLLANLIALYLNKPLTDIDSFVDGRIYNVGNTKNTKGIKRDNKKINKVLIIDDSVFSGNSIKEAKEKIKTISNKYEYLFLAAYVCDDNKNLVDIYFKSINDIRMFEWNYIHHKRLINVCFDLDGVMCVDPTLDENDDGEKYKNFLINAKPKLIPTRPIGYIVTSRLEKYRKETEEWLKKYNIEYKKLYMMNYSSAKERQKNADHGLFKAQIYDKIKDSVLFIESEKEQAEQISSISHKAVFCIENQEFYSEKGTKYIKAKAKTKIYTFLKTKIKPCIPRKILTKIKKYRKRG